jgi:hypothetical protein
MSAEHTPPANTMLRRLAHTAEPPINAAAQETTDDEVRRSGHEGFISPAAAPNEPVAPSADEVRELADKWANTLIHLNGPTATDENRRERLDAATEAYYVFNRALKRLAERASPQAAQPPALPEPADWQIEAGYRSFEWSSVPHPFRGSVGFERGVRWALERAALSQERPNASVEPKRGEYQCLKI